jgi:uncharacterized membrane protein YdjX (TVP38/TMEM64 family)
MEELEVTFSRVLSVWWLLFWRAALGSVLLGGIAGFIIGIGFGILHKPLEPIFPTVAGGIVGFIWFFLVVRMALRKKYRDFRIALVPHNKWDRTSRM